jgi:nanoRNase/pAp phosphatase (c-di-AMP/oligoRNAs hydrolase)
MIKTVGIPIQRFDEGVLNTNPILATLDAQPPFFSRGESGLSGKDLHFDIVIDHHPRTKFGKVRFSDIRPSYGSTSTILSEYFLYYKKRIPRRVATALLYGLKADTNNLQREVNTADVLAFNRLRTYADENLVRKIELSQFPQVTLDHFQTALVKKKILGDVLFVYLGYIDDPDTCVYIADFYIRVSGISWAIVSSISKEKLIVVFRSDGFKKDAGKAAAIAFGEFGSAGGHRVMARAEVDLLRLLAEIHSHSEHYIEQWIIQRLSLCFPRFGGLT